MTTIYVCYQREDKSIMAITSSEETAQKICSETGDCYVPMSLNKNYGREPLDSTDKAIYNIKGQFFSGSYLNTLGFFKED